MIPWIFLAVSGHLANAVAFVIDKTLLSSAFRRSATYAALIGILSLIVLAAAPWVSVWPGRSAFPYAVGFGAFQIFALWAFFEALRRGEASRVVPIVGSLIPLFTLLGTSFFLHERFSLLQSFGFGLLLLATILLSSGGSVKHRLSFATVGFAVISSLLFALSFVSGKIAYEHAPFLGVFVLSRGFAVLGGIFILLLDRDARSELLGLLKPQTTARPKVAAAWAVFGQLMGAGGFILINVALAAGSAPIINALQAVQYSAIVLAAWFGGAHLRRLLKEERTTTAVTLKTIAILLTGLGLFLVSRIPNS